MKRTEGAREVLDGPIGAAELAATLADIDRLNAWFGGHALTLAPDPSPHGGRAARSAR